MEPTGHNPALSFAVYAGLAYEMFSSVTSSPQTTELNAAARAATLWKWVRLAELQLAGYTVLGAVIAKDAGFEVWPILLGGGLAGALLWAQYRHALKSGLASTEPPTESY